MNPDRQMIFHSLPFMYLQCTITYLVSLLCMLPGGPKPKKVKQESEEEEDDEDGDDDD